MNDAVLDALELEIKQDEPTSSKNVKKLYQSCLNESIFHRHTYFNINNLNISKYIKIKLKQTEKNGLKIYWKLNSVDGH